MELSNLQANVRYVFYIADFVTPHGEVIPGQRKDRVFIGIKERGAVGMPKIPFVEVQRDNGTRHLIAAETIRTVESV